eukprot:TRINITY_DN4533_c0_g2_i2.p1 TRINITY_DN4533_c0_g2~~TRINITY_DN4533_c0_g2_i2.p1  ORF type:complete len:216 (+),score=29.12 TRINITY_DN4533_c0_g2_i2:78-725(+)
MRSKEAATNEGTTVTSNGICCKWEMPWLFQSLLNLASTVVSGLHHHVNNSHDSKKPVIVERQSIIKKQSFTLPWGRQSSRDDSELRALAAALQSKKNATVIEFYSPKCRLCSSMSSVVSRIQSDNSDWLNIVMADVENRAWLPEVIHYDIKYVPCFVLLDKCGTALAKTGTPVSRLHVLTGLFHLLEILQPAKKRGNVICTQVSDHTVKSKRVDK